MSTDSLHMRVPFQLFSNATIFRLFCVTTKTLVHVMTWFARTNLLSTRWVQSHDRRDHGTKFAPITYYKHLILHSHAAECAYALSQRRP
jgi:hypothetical protein